MAPEELGVLLGVWTGDLIGPISAFSPLLAQFAPAVLLNLPFFVNHQAGSTA